MARIIKADTGALHPTDRLSERRHENASRLIGYARVSTHDQDCAAQVYELSQAGCSEIVQEHASGADRRRPALARLVSTIERGETLVIVRLDRLARSVPHLLAVLADLDDRGAGLRSLRDPVDTTTAGGRFVITILGAVAELERSLIIERTRAGLAAAVRAGRLPGHPGLRTGDAAAVAHLARLRSAHSLARSQAALQPWMATVAADRPGTAWETIARRIAAAGGPTWSGERLRRTWQRMRKAGRV